MSTCRFWCMGTQWGGANHCKHPCNWAGASFSNKLFIINAAVGHACCELPAASVAHRMTLAPKVYRHHRNIRNSCGGEFSWRCIAHNNKSHIPNNHTVQYIQYIDPYQHICLLNHAFFMTLTLSQNLNPTLKNDNYNVWNPFKCE